MYSMTGYGSSSKKFDNKSLDIELKSINSKFFDLNIKSNFNCFVYEKNIRKLIKNKMVRGKIDLTLSLNDLQNQNDIINKKDFKIIYNKIEKLDINKDVSKDVIFNNSMNLYDKKILTKELKISKKKLLDSLNTALNKCVKSRLDEGLYIRKDIKKKINNISVSLNEIIRIDKMSRKRKENQLRKKIKEIGLKFFNKKKLEEEIFYHLDKIDINEEIKRLKKHILLFNKTIIKKSPAGKIINFICQEIGREVNTIGAKSNHFQIQKHTIKMKFNLEKIKEEAFNIL
tara:strand:- start:2422 stop:3279 length:858 start_codon:yes stop_codon:yes gene_type:complete